MTFSQQRTALQTILIKEVLRFMRIWVQTVLPPMITTALYFVIFGNLIGRRIGEMGGVSYVEYMVPGLVLMAIITNAYANVVSSFFGSKFQRNIEEMLVSPMPNYLIVLGYLAGGVARGLVVGLAVMLVSIVSLLLAGSAQGDYNDFFSVIHVQHPLIIASMALLTSLLFSLAGLINGVYAKKFDDITIIPTFILTPLTYLGGVFYSITLLSPFWQNISMLNPILHMVNAFRYGFLGISDVNVFFSYLICVGFIMVLYFYSLHLMNKGYGMRN